MFRLLLLLLWVLAIPVVAQDNPELVPNRAFQVKFDVPADWRVTHQRTDSVELLGYHSPDSETRLWVGRLRGRHAQLRPAQALPRLLRELGATRHEEHALASGGLDFRESTGTCFVDGRELRYDARVTNYQGQALLVYLYATPSAYSTQAPLLHRVLDSLTPLRGK